MGALQLVGLDKADTVERLERELVKLGARRAELAEEIEGLSRREDELEDDGEFLATMAAGRTARTRLRKLDAQIAASRQRLELARDTARAKLRAELLAKFAPAARDYIAAGRAAQETLDRVIAAREALQAAGFRQEYNSLPVPPNVAGTAFPAPDLLGVFEAALDPTRRLSAAAPADTQPRPPKRQAARARLQHEPVSHLFESTTGSAPAAKPAIRPLLRETAAEGEQLIVMIRGGVERPRTGQQLRTGDMIALSPDEATHLLRSAAADLVAVEAPGQLNTSDAVADQSDQKEPAHG